MVMRGTEQNGHFVGGSRWRLLRVRHGVHAIARMWKRGGEVLTQPPHVCLHAQVLTLPQGKISACCWKRRHAENESTIAFRKSCRRKSASSPRIRPLFRFRADTDRAAVTWRATERTAE